MGKEKQTIDFIYIKPKNPTLSVNGVYGGPSKFLGIDMHFFYERTPIPNKTIRELNDDGSMGKVIKQDRSDGVIREVQCSINMDILSAKTFVTWLNEKIESIEKQKIFEKIDGNKL